MQNVKNKTFITKMKIVKTPAAPQYLNNTTKQGFLQFKVNKLQYQVIGMLHNDLLNFTEIQ